MSGTSSGRSRRHSARRPKQLRAASSQTSLFSPAVDLKERGLQALRALDPEKASRYLRSAAEIDPGLPEIDNLVAVASFLSKAGATPDLDPPGLSRLWVQARASYVLKELSLRNLECVDKLICQAAVKRARKSLRGYLDPDAPALHIGYCYLVLHEPFRAHRKLFDDLAPRPLGCCGDLWGYLGDAATQMRFPERANMAYVRAWFGDPDHVDVRVLQHPGIRQLYERLRAGHNDKTARHLLAIHAWMHSFLEIPAADRAMVGFVRRQLRQADRVRDTSDEGRYRRFGLLLYEDQACEQAAGFDVRSQMKDIDEQLFWSYLQVNETRRQRRHPG